MSEAERFVQANTLIVNPPLVEEIVLHLASEILPIWNKSEEQLSQQGIPPPFWAFAWAGGQALSRYVLDHRGAVAGKFVLDFASGSGLAGIAAMLAGARSVHACEIDSFACAAIGLNARLNGVAIHQMLGDIVGRDGGWDVVLAGDVCYERDMSRRVFDWLLRLAHRGALVLLGDPGRNYLPQSHLHELAVYDVPTTRELEDRELRRTIVWRVGSAAANIAL